MEQEDLTMVRLMVALHTMVQTVVTTDQKTHRQVGIQNQVRSKIGLEKEPADLLVEAQVNQVVLDQKVEDSENNYSTN